jgi:predicted helicase
MDLHINYENAEPFQLQITNYELQEGQIIKSKLKSDKEAGIIILDDCTELSGIPAEAWNYKLGNRSALEWILDQYKESKPKDSTIAEKFNTYKFADYKEQVIALLKKVCTVSVETMKIIREMENI